MTAVTDYCTLQLAATGFAIVNARAAMRIRPDLWPNANMVCAVEFGQHQHQAPALVSRFPGATLYTAEIGELGRVPVLAYSADELARRIVWATGYRVQALEPYAPPQETTVAPIHAGIARHQVRMDKLRQLAAQEPPSHDCEARRDILAARAELERLEPKPSPVEKSTEGDNEGDNGEPAIERAKELLENLLTDGPIEAAVILAQAEDDNLSERTMQRAADAMGVVKSKVGFSGGWVWALPEEQAAV
jgi:hypothetical protein